MLQLLSRKKFGAYGDGGAVVTNDQKLAEKVARLRNYGQIAKYDHSEKGWNARLDAIQAAVLNVKLKYLDEWNHSRINHATDYNEHLKMIDELLLPQVQQGRDHVFHLYVIRSRMRNQLQEFLTRRNITTLIHYPIPIHLQKAYKELGHKQGNFPNTERAASEILSLPMFAELQPFQKRYVIEAVHDFYEKSEEMKISS